jgi:hypothetical protein
MQAPLVEPDTEPSSVLEPTGKQQDWWHKRRWLVPIAAIVLCSLATTLWLIRHKKAPAPHSLLSSSATDTHGVLRLKGTTQAVRTRSIQAPLLAGEKEGTLTITDLRAAGSSVKQGDILVEFDRQAQLRDSLDKQAQNSKLGLPSSNEPEQTWPAQNSEAHFTYQYDDHGNWTEKVTSNSSSPGAPFETTGTIRRSLTYF